MHHSYHIQKLDSLMEKALGPRKIQCATEKLIFHALRQGREPTTAKVTIKLQPRLSVDTVRLPIKPLAIRLTFLPGNIIESVSRGLTRSVSPKCWIAIG